MDTKKPIVRLLGSYAFEGGAVLEVRVIGDVETTEALEMLKTLIGLKEAELEKREPPHGDQ